MKVAVYSDCHVGSLFQVFTVEELYKSVLDDRNAGILTVSLGDNIDLKGCKKSDSEKLEDFYWEMNDLFDLHVSGNHELQTIIDDNVANIGGHLISLHHGDVAKYGKDKAWDMRNRGKMGSSLPMRVLKLIGHYYRNVIPWTLGGSEAAYLYNYEKTYVQWSGHTHPKTLQKRGNILVFPMGRTEIEL